MHRQSANAGHLSGLRAKIAKRDAKDRSGKGNKAPTGIRFKVPQSVGGQRETLEQRQRRLAARRLRQRQPA